MPLSADWFVDSSSDTTSAADAATESAVSARKQRRKPGVTSAKKKVAASVGSTIWNAGKKLLTGTGFTAATAVGGDWIANKVEDATSPSSTGFTASTSKQGRSVSSTEEKEAASVGSTIWNAGKKLLTTAASTVGGDYITNKIEGVISPSSTAAASARKRNYDGSNDEESLLNRLRIDTIEDPIQETPSDNNYLQGSLPTHVQDQKRKVSLKKLGGDTVERDLATQVGTWVVDNAPALLRALDSDSDSSAATRKRSTTGSLAGNLVLKSGKKAASKVVHDETKNKIMDYLSNLGDKHSSDLSKMLKRSDSGELASLSDLYVRDPQGFLTVAEGLWEPAGDQVTDASGPTQNGNEVAEIGTEVRKRSLEAAADVLEDANDIYSVMPSSSPKLS